MNNKPLTVLELKELLEKLMLENPKCADYPVSTEGCDCSGDAVDVAVDDTYEQAEITRKSR